MSDTILSGDWTIYYLNENRQKRLKYSGSGTIYTVNQLYSAILDHFDESNQMDDGTPMSAATPTSYTIGKVDAGDNEPWFIDHTSVEYLSGGALNTSGWERVEGSNVGVIRVECTNTSIVAADIGHDIVHTNGDTGTLLDIYDTGGALTILWIRPDDDTEPNSFPDSTGTLTCNTNTATQDAGGVTGELLWANIYNTGLATLQPTTHQYIEQEGSLLTAYKATSDWWDDGQFDILVQVKEPGAIGTGSSEVDYGKIRVLARKYTTGYTWFEVDLSAGGRNPIPLTSLVDLDNTTGYKSVVLAGAEASLYTVGDRISDDDINPHGIITSITDGGTATPTLHYFQVGDPLDDFADSETCYNLDAVGTDGTVNGAPSDQGPALASWFSGAAAPSITFGYTNSYDIDENGTAEDYSVIIDLNQASLAEMWEWLKYTTRRGNVADIDVGAQTIEGQFYRGIERKFVYSSQAGSFTEGNTVYFYDVSDVLQARGVLGAIEDNGAAGELMMYEYIVVGTEANITKASDSDPYSGTNAAAIDSFTVITPVQKCPFGDFAGGTFFGADGVVIIDYISTEANSFQLKDNAGSVTKVPTKISLTIGNTRIDDKIAIIRVDVNGDIIRNAYNSHATNNVQADLTFEVDGTPSIANDEPGKTTGGILRVVAVDEQREHRYRFASWDTDTVTLATTSATADAGGSQTSLYDADGDFLTGPKAKVGDLVFNSTELTFGYVTAVTTDTLTMTNTGSNAPVTDWSSDGYIINGLVQTYDANDTVWIPLMDTLEDTGTDASPGSEGVNITYVSGTDVRVIARNATGTYKMLPYAAVAAVAEENFSNNIIRNDDTISTN